MDTTTQIISIFLSAALTGFVTYYFGLRRFLEQRRADRIQERYINEGFDEPTWILGQALGTTESNYLKVTAALDRVRLGLPTEVKSIQLAPITIENSAQTFVKRFFAAGEHAVIVEWVRKAEAEMYAFDLYLRHDVLAKLEQPGAASEVGKRFEALQKHWDLVESLTEILAELDAANITRVEDLHRFKTSPKFMQAIENLENQYRQYYP